MRIACPWGGAALLWVCCSLTAHAETAPYESTVTVPEVEARSGPSSDPKFYPTSRLRQGDKVQVLKEEEGGWLAIKPPIGSFSWVNTRFIEVSSQHTSAQVLGDDVVVRVGSELVNTEPTVEAKVKLKRGTQVVVLDSKRVYTSDGGWLPIAPTPEEVRYIPASAVKPSAQVQTVQSSPPAVPPADGVGPLASDPLWQQAQQFEQAGRPADAADLYLRLAHKTADHDLQMRCYNRVHFLRQGMGASVPPGYTVGRPSTAQYPNQDTRLIPTPSTNQPVPAFPASAQPYQPAPAGQVTSQYTYQKQTPRLPTSGPLAQASGPGRLRRAPFFLDNKPTYVLESSQGLPLMYVTAVPGVNLEPYVNRNVDMWGMLVYRGDVKTNYMTVQQVKTLP